MSVVTEQYGKQQVRQEIQQPMPEAADAHQWFESFSAFWIAGILPVILAWFAYRSLKIKVEKHNEERRRRYHEAGRDSEYEDHTALDYFKSLK